jgi:hypothetical protein
LVHAAPGDTVRFPLIGVTNMDLARTRLDRSVDLSSVQRETNPIHPQVLVLQDFESGTDRIAYLILFETIFGRDPEVISLDGGGTGLRVSALGSDWFAGSYDRWGVLGTDQGVFCAALTDAM